MGTNSISFGATGQNPQPMGDAQIRDLFEETVTTMEHAGDDKAGLSVEDFNAMNSNGDGVLSATEVRDFMLNQGISGDQANAIATKFVNEFGGSDHLVGKNEIEDGSVTEGWDEFSGFDHVADAEAAEDAIETEADNKDDKAAMDKMLDSFHTGFYNSDASEVGRLQKYFDGLSMVKNDAGGVDFYKSDGTQLTGDDIIAESQDGDENDAEMQQWIDNWADSHPH